MRQGAEGRESDVFAAVELCETRAKILEAKSRNPEAPDFVQQSETKAAQKLEF